jgi:hypothetical protein
MIDAIADMVMGLLLALPGLLCVYWVCDSFYGIENRKNFLDRLPSSALFGLMFVFLVVAAGIVGLLIAARAAVTLLGELGSRLSPNAGEYFFAVLAAGFVYCAAVEYLTKRRFLQFVNTAHARCRKCGYPLRGLRSRRGRIRCPECGYEEPIREIVARHRALKARATRIRSLSPDDVDSPESETPRADERTQLCPTCQGSGERAETMISPFGLALLAMGAIGFLLSSGVFLLRALSACVFLLGTLRVRRIIRTECIACHGAGQCG